MKVLRNFMLVVMVALGVGLCFNPTANVKAASGVGTVKNVKKSKVKCVKNKKINGKKCSGNYRTISWKKVKGADGYVVYRYDDLMDTWNKVLTTKKTSFIVSSLLEDETMTVKIQAYKGSIYGNFSKIFKYREKNRISLRTKGKVMTKGCYAEGKSGFFEYASKQAFIIQNQYRTEKGVAPLAWSNELYEVAKIRCKELTKLFSHTRPNGEGCSEFFEEYFGYDRCKRFQNAYREMARLAGLNRVRSSDNLYNENIGRGIFGVRGIMQGWKASIGHYNTMTNYELVVSSISCYCDKGDTEYWTSSFAYINVDNIK
ncbi:CAP domain-containing protein [uncultured Eubacterium sp.]|uniref:CAP domain-containing protein n=1 Tax=uncultured Eubacterium sp. TaxID=165185 RepID=UPI0032669D60